MACRHKTLTHPALKSNIRLLLPLLLGPGEPYPQRCTRESGGGELGSRRGASPKLPVLFLPVAGKQAGEGSGTQTTAWFPGWLVV